MCDVIVVGAGPAGATAARLCALAGLETLIVERAVFPRDKPCAGGLSPRVLADITRVFSLEPQETGEPAEGANTAGPDPGPVLRVPRLSLRAHLHHASRPGLWSGYRRIRVDTPTPLMYLADRARLDARLADGAVQAGARVLWGTEAVTWRQDAAGVDVTAREAGDRGAPPRSALVRLFRGQYLIGADGAVSVVARGLTRRPGPAAGCLSLRLALGKEQAERVTRGALDFHFGIVRAGYGWAFPGAGGLAVGVGGIIPPGAYGFYASLETPLGRVLGTYGLDTSVAGAAPKRWMVPLGGVRRGWVEGRVLLAGDAAGVADPVTGEGIGPAVRSGAMAARAVVTALRGGRAASVPETYAAALGLREGERGEGHRGRGKEGAYERDLWESEIARQRRGLWVTRAAGKLPPGWQSLMFRRSVFAWVAGKMGSRATGGERHG